MPDTRTRRGPHPKDLASFALETLPGLRRAVADLSWLKGRGYSPKASLKLVGDRHSLRDRQRKALQRCAASDEDCAGRAERCVELDFLAGEIVIIDGYNVILTIEAALIRPPMVKVKRRYTLQGPLTPTAWVARDLISFPDHGTSRTPQRHHECLRGGSILTKPPASSPSSQGRQDQPTNRYPWRLLA